MSNLENSNTTFMTYYFRFGLVLLAMYILVAVIRVVLSLESVSSVTFLLPLLAAQFVAEAFIKKLGRVPTDLEITQLSRGCILITISINIPLALIGLFAGAVDKSFGSTFVIIVGGILMIVLIANYFMIRWAFNGLAKKRAEKLGIGRLEDEF